MNPNDEKARAAIAEQAGEWLVANEEGPLDARESAALATWFKTSPVHVEEFLGVAAVARDLQQVRGDPHFSLQAILARARAEQDDAVHRLRAGDAGDARAGASWRRRPAAVAMAACVLLAVGLLLRWDYSAPDRPATPEQVLAIRFETGHGQQLTRSLPDHSVVRLNTDTRLSIRYSKDERLVVLSSGQAAFEVAHEGNRAFRVRAGSADITDLGTRFDVRLDEGATVVTVVEGLVAVGPRSTSQSPDAQAVELGADQQLRVAGGTWPARPVAVDAKRATSWSQGKLIFDNETLARVVAEYNRYSPKPIEIATPALRRLRISGVFATNDTEAFVAFLRSLKGVRVEVGETRIRVFAE